MLRRPMTKMVRKKLVTLYAILTMAIASSVDAKNIKTYGPTQITGTLTLENADDLFVTTDDFILADRKFPAKHIAVWPCEQGTQSRYDSLKKLANTGKQVTIRGFFRPVTGRAGIGMAVPFAFCLAK
jgi:hypothetical protein